MKRRQVQPRHVLLRGRSSNASLREAWRTLLPNLGAISFSLLLPSLAFGLIMALFFIGIRYADGVVLVVIHGVTAMLLALVVAWMGRVLHVLLTERMASDTRLVSRLSLRSVFGMLSVEFLPSFYCLVMGLMAFVVIALGAYKMMQMSVWVLPMFALLLFILLVFFTTSFMRIVCFKDTCAKALLWSLKVGMRYFASSSSMMLSTVILFLIFAALLFMPLFILNLAIHASNEAVLFGDATDIPSYILTIHFLLSCLLLTMIGLLLSCTALIPHIYHIHSLEQKERERQKQTASI